MPAPPAGTGKYARYTQALTEAQVALATARALDLTLVFLVVALIVGVWWARRK